MDQSPQDYLDARADVEVAETPEQAQAALLKQAEAALSSGAITQAELDQIVESLSVELTGENKERELGDDFDPF